jgi:hypothetical protein
MRWLLRRWWFWAGTGFILVAIAAGYLVIPVGEGRISQANCDRIQLGMTFAEVKSVAFAVVTSRASGTLPDSSSCAGEWTMPGSQVGLRERVLGCILGCAVGDALGAPYEGLWPHQIPDQRWLLADFAEIEGYPKGQYTDDTQLSVATVESLVASGDLSLPHLARSIARLLKRQAVVGPGGACTHAAQTFLRTGDWTTCGAAVGQAGNGTAMRTAVLGLFSLRNRTGCLPLLPTYRGLRITTPAASLEESLSQRQLNCWPAIRQTRL